MSRSAQPSLREDYNYTTSGNPPVNDYEAFSAFNIISKLGSRCAIHADDQELMLGLEQRLRNAGKSSPLTHLESRPPLVEAEAIQRGILLAKSTGVRLHIAHLSSKEWVDLVCRAKSEGVPISAETALHYLLLSTADYRRLGSIIKINPPVRTKHDCCQLWQGIHDGTVDILATDHSPHSLKEKKTDNIWSALSGFAGVETQLPLMLTQINKGKLTLSQYVGLSSEKPAKIFGIYPRKGAVQIGSDCDIVIVELKKKWRLRSEDLHSKTKVTPFDGWRVQGLVTHTILRGQVIMEHGEIVKYGEGRLVRLLRGGQF
jgi:dihydroorotase